MSDESQHNRQLDVMGTTGGKATVETTQKSRRLDTLDVLLSSRDYTRDDTLLGEIVRICLQLDKAGFAKVYAMVKAEEALMDARHRRRLDTLIRPAEEPPPAGSE